jgi:phage terminase small subunit
MERAFAATMQRTGDPAYSAEKAGYSQPGSAASKLMAKPDVAEEVRRRARHRLQTEGAEVGVRVLIEVATDELQKGSARVAAAKALVQASGVASVQSLSEADLAEMPPDKIRELLGQAQRQLEARMVTVSGRELPIEADSAQDAPNPTRSSVCI